MPFGTDPVSWLILLGIFSNIEPACGKMRLYRLSIRRYFLVKISNSSDVLLTASTVCPHSICFIICLIRHLNH